GSCDFSAWAGGQSYMSRITFEGGQLKASATYTAPTSILSGSCGQGGSIVATGTGRRLYYFDPTGLRRMMTVPGTGSLVAVATGPGPVPYGLVLDYGGGQGKLWKYQFGLPYVPDANSASGCRVKEFKLRLKNSF